MKNNLLLLLKRMLIRTSRLSYRKARYNLFQVLIFLAFKCKPPDQDHAQVRAYSTCCVPQPHLIAWVVVDKQHRYNTNVVFKDGHQLHQEAMEMAVNVFPTCTEVYVTEWFQAKHARQQMRCQQECAWLLQWRQQRYKTNHVRDFPPLHTWLHHRRVHCAVRGEDLGAEERINLHCDVFKLYFV